MSNITVEKAIAEEIATEAGNDVNTNETAGKVGKMSKGEFFRKVMSNELSNEQALLKLQNKLHNCQLPY